MNDRAPRFQQPGWFTKNVFNRIVVGLARMGVSIAGSRVLEVKGRKSGKWRQTPVNPLSFEGNRYLVAPRGDTQWVRGTVARRYLTEGDRPAVDLDLECVNQRGQVTTPGHATVLLPSREHGAVRLPDVPGGATDLQGALEAISDRFER